MLFDAILQYQYIKDPKYPPKHIFICLFLIFYGMTNVVVTLKMPDFVSVGESFTINYVVENPLDEDVEVYIFFIGREGELIPPVVEEVPAGESRGGSVVLTADSVPFSFIVRSEAYVGNTVVGVAQEEVVLEKAPAKANIPLFLGLSSLLWGAAHG
jgi:hypothetical protein